MKLRMNRILVLGLAWSIGHAAPALWSSAARAQEGVVTPSQASRSGLVVHWFSQLDAVDAESVVGLELVVDEDRATTFFQISGGGLSEVISEHDLSPFGQPMGVEGAREYAGIRKEIFEAQLKRDLKEAAVTVEQFTVPETSLYTSSRTGVVNCIDAETGKLRWKTTVGDYRQPTLGIAASKTHLAVINGSNVYCLDSKTGKVIWKRMVRSSLSGPPAVNEHFVFVPTDDGGLETLPLDISKYARPVYRSIGRPLGGNPPILEGKSVAWPTERGVTVAPSDRLASMRFRVETESPVMAPLAARDGILFFASRDGYVYAVRETSGSILWQIPIGQPISAAPVPVGDDLLVITKQDMLFRLEAHSGRSREGWQKPVRDVRQFLGATDKRLYVLNSRGSLVTLDRTTGAVLGSTSQELSLRSFSNLLSDRLYVCHQSGMIQCLREVGSNRPVFHAREWSEVAKAGPAAKVPSNRATASDSPFGAADADNDNPFGGSTGGTTSQPASDDPFSGGSSAGSMPATDNSADPFSGGAPATGNSQPTPPADEPAASDDPFAGGGMTTPAGDASGNDATSGAGQGGNAPEDPDDPFAGGGASSSGDSGAAAPDEGMDSDDPFAGGGGGTTDDEPAGGNEDPEDATEDAGSSAVSWKEVNKVLSRRCGNCHRTGNAKAGFDASSRDAIIQGGRTGPAVVPGSPEESLLYKLISHTEEPRMPPQGKLGDKDIQLIADWIKGGALDD